MSGFFILNTFEQADYHGVSCRVCSGRYEESLRVCTLVLCYWNGRSQRYLMCEQAGCPRM